MWSACGPPARRKRPPWDAALMAGLAEGVCGALSTRFEALTSDCEVFEPAPRRDRADADYGRLASGARPRPALGNQPKGRRVSRLGAWVLDATALQVARFSRTAPGYQLRGLSHRAGRGSPSMPAPAVPMLTQRR